MTQIRLYLDEDTMDGNLITALRCRNVDVLSTECLGRIIVRSLI